MKEDGAIERFEREQRRLRMERLQEPRLLLVGEIEAQAPEVPGWGGGTWAVYSVGCCWWTTRPADLGHVDAAPLPTKTGAGRGLPCCPHCGSMLLQAPLADFLKAARAEPGHYGPGGLLTLARAWAGNATTCHRGWAEYDRRDAPPLSYRIGGRHG